MICQIQYDDYTYSCLFTGFLNGIDYIIFTSINFNVVECGLLRIKVFI